MSELDDRLDREVRRLAGEVDGAQAFERVAGLKRRRRAIRWTQQAALAAAIVVGSAAGAFALARAFVGEPIPSDQPAPGPTVTAPGPAGPCPDLGEGGDLPETYRPIGDSRTGDVTGDGGADGVRLVGDEDRPPRCRYFLRVEDAGSGVFLSPVVTFDYLPVPPSIFALAEVDGEAGLEVVVEFGGPAHPHRTGQMFAFHEGSLVQTVLLPGPGEAFPLYGEFPSGADCTGEPGHIVVTFGDLAEGGTDDSRYELTRRFYRARDGAFFETRRETHVVEVGTEDERWPELADDSFRSCPGAQALRAAAAATAATATSSAAGGRGRGRDGRLRARRGRGLGTGRGRR